MARYSAGYWLLIDRGCEKVCRQEEDHTSVARGGVSGNASGVYARNAQLAYVSKVLFRPIAAVVGYQFNSGQSHCVGRVTALSSPDIRHSIVAIVGHEKHVPDLQLCDLLGFALLHPNLLQLIYFAL